MSTDPWIAPEGIQIPDFIICGAMKSGTSTLHYILNEHPQVFIPKSELAFFDVDNILQHWDFNFFNGSEWFTQQIKENPLLHWKWYSSHFDEAADGQILGEDSTTYLASEVAAKRIRMQDKRIKVIIMLRHPTNRAYSQYWHMLRTGRVMYSFEDTLRFDPYSVLNRSLYREQLRSFYEHIPQEQIRVVVLEEFLENKCDTLRELCDFIGVEYDLLSTRALDAHKNKGLTPKYPSIQIMKNKLFRDAGNSIYYSRLPIKPEWTLGGKTKVRVLKMIDRVHRKLNPLSEESHHKIRPSTKRFLDDFFRDNLEGINEILGKDVMSIWFG